MPDSTPPGRLPQPIQAAGMVEYRDMLAHGFSAQEANEWQARETRDMLIHGFTPAEVDAHWGTQTPTSPHTQKAFDANLLANLPRVDRSGILENIAAGWDVSVGGLILQGKAPKENTQPRGIPGLAAYAAGQVAGDIIPAIGGALAGAPMGGAAGAAIPVAGETGVGEVAGGIIGAGAGSAMLPEAMRQTLIGAYQRGEVHSPMEWLQVVGHGTTETLKAGVVGAVGNMVGGKVSNVVVSKGGGALAAKAAGGVSNALASTATMGAVNGRVPSAEDFIAGSIIAVGTEAGTTVAGKFRPSSAAQRVQKNLQDIYVETGIDPREAAAKATSDPVWRQRVLAQDVNGNPVVDPAVRQPQPEPFTDRTKLVNVSPGAKPAPMPERARVPAMGHIENFMRIMGGVEHGTLDKADDTAVSPAGARGRYQIMPGTARQYGFDPARLMDPAYNEKVSRAIAADLYNRYHGDEEAMLAAYNAGPGRANRLVTSGPGTRLVATDNKGKVTFHSETAARDESFLPMETQKYLANARRRYGGELPGSRGGQSSGKVPPEQGSMLAIEDQRSTGGGDGGGSPPARMPDWALYKRPEETAGGGGDGGEPPVPPKPPGPDEWSNASSDDLYAEIGKGIGDDFQVENKMTVTSALDKWVSELEPARQIDQDLIDAGKGYRRDRDMLTEDMFRQTYGSANRASSFVRTGIVDAITLNVDKDSASLMKAADAVKKDGGNLGDWMKWMIAQRVGEVEGRGMKSGFNKDAAAALRARPEETKKYQRATDIFNEVDRGVLEYGRDSGFFSQAQIDGMMNTAVHVSFRRMMGEAEIPLGGKKRGFKVSGVTKRMEGSDRQIVNPVLSTLDNISLIVKMADRNRAVGHVVAMVEAGAPDIGIKKVGTPDVDTKDLAIYGLQNDAAAKEAYTPALAKKATDKLNKNQFLYFREGKPEVWQAESETVARLMRGAETQPEADIVTKTAQFLASTMRAGIVNVAEFPVRNALVDQIRTFVLDPLHPPPFLTMARGAFHVWGKGSDVYHDWIAKGGAGSAMTQMDADYLSRDMHAIFQETGTWGAIWNTVQHPLEFAQIVQERIDAASRVGYYQNATGKGLDPVKAATMSRKAYLDFAEKGTGFLTNYMAKVIPFYRTGMIGLKQVGESVKEKPIETAFYMSTIAVATAGLYAMNYLQDQNSDLPESRKFRQRERWEKDMFFITPEMAGVRLKLRMPQPVSMIGGMTNRFLDHWLEKDPHAFDGWAKAVLKDMMPNLLPPAVVPPLEQWANRSFFTGKPLIPASLEGASGQTQYMENTTETAKAISRLLAPTTGVNLVDVSPIVLENYVRGWTGSLGYGILKNLDIPFDPSHKPWELADIPFVSGFVLRNKTSNAASIQTFYDELDEFKQAAKDFSLAKKRVGEGGDVKAFQEAASDPRAFAKFDGISDALATQSAIIRGITNNKDMNPDEKRQYVEQIYESMIQLSMAGSNGMRQVEAAMREDAAPPLNAPAMTGMLAPAQGPTMLPTAPASAPPLLNPGAVQAPPVGVPGSPGLGEPLKVMVN